MSEDATKLGQAWDLHKQANNLVHSRMTYAMIAQSMFIMSYATALLESPTPPWVPPAVQILIACFGLWFTWRQYVLVNELTSKMDFLRETYLVPLDPIYKKYNGVEPRRKAGGSHQLTLIPGLSVLWVFLLAIAGYLLVRGIRAP